jgi:hypothetical protein
VAGRERGFSVPQNAVAVKPIPKGYHSVTPHLIVDGAPREPDRRARAARG